MKRILLSLAMIISLAQAEFIRDDNKEVVIDTTKNLMWQDNLEAKTVEKNWQGAIDYCGNLTLGGFDDWKLPDKDTLKALYPQKDRLNNVRNNAYWSRSTNANYNNDRAWYVYFGAGYDDDSIKYGSYLVRCVRDSKNDNNKINNMDSVSDRNISPYPLKPIFKLDTSGHQGIIGDVIVTKDKKIITASDDKTIRIWNSMTHQEERKILGQIGDGNEGAIFAIALSSDEKYLAVGGFLAKGNGVNDDSVGSIRIYDFKTGKIIHILKSHLNIVLDLAFDSKNNLYSASSDKTVKIWNFNDGSFNLLKTVTNHTDSVQGVIALEDGSFVSVGDDNKIFLTDKFERIKSFSYKNKLQFVATNGKIIAASGINNEILIFDKDLNLKQTIINESEPSGLSFSPNGTKLLAGVGRYPFKSIIYDVMNNFKEISAFQQFNIVRAVSFFDDETALLAGGTRYEIALWKIDDIYKSVIFMGYGQPISRVGINENKIGFGNVFNANGNPYKNYSSVENIFDFDSYSLIPYDIKKDKNKGRTAKYEFKLLVNEGLSHSQGGEFDSENGVLNLPSGAKITRGYSTGFGHKTYGWADEFIISGGGNGELTAFDKNGNTVAKFIGHTGDIVNIAIENETMVSGGSNQIIYLWDLKKLSSPNKSLVQSGWFSKEWIDWIRTNYPNENINSEDGIRSFYNALLKNNDKTNSKVLEIPSNIYPKLSLFVSKDNEWVLWTKEGFFNASKNGAKYIGYHINKGADKEAEFVSVDKLYKAFYRPDLVEKALNGEDLSSYAQNINISDILKSGLAPKVAIKTTTRESSKKDIELELEVCTKDGDRFDNPTLLLNGMAVSILDKNRAIKPKNPNQYQECVTFRPLITLSSGENKIGFKATNANGMIESNTDEITINYHGTTNTKPNLHILAIGVDKYRDGDLQLKYSVADAKEITKSLKTNSGGLFGETFTYELFDKDVTKQKLLEKFAEVGAKTTREDVFIFYMAGHGITDAKTGAYFYLPSDFRYKNEDSVRTSGVSQDDFTLALSRIQALKSITLIDTCNSGSFAEALASRGVLQKTAIDKLTRATGRATLVASSKDQVALEGYEGHGVFTYTMMEALNGKGYKGGKITIKNLASYIEDVLPERTYQKWGYEQVPQSHITGTDFPIGVK